MELLGSTVSWDEKNKLEKECRDLLSKAKSIEEFDEIYTKYYKKYKVMIACAILAYREKEILRRAMLDLAVFMPDVDTRRKSFISIIERNNKLYDETYALGMEILKEVSEMSDELLQSLKLE